MGRGWVAGSFFSSWSARLSVVQRTSSDHAVVVVPSQNMLEHAFTSYKHTQSFRFNFEERDVDISYLVPSKQHWKLVTIQVRHIPVPALQRQIIVCNSSLQPCCPKAPETPDTIEKFYQSHLKNGGWINGGYVMPKKTICCN